MIGWLDGSSGASGDMFLGALVAVGVPIEVLQSAVDVVAPEPIRLRVEEVLRNGFAATRVHVEVADSSTHRTYADIKTLLEPLDEPVRTRALATFERLAVAEAAVHGTTPDDVHFHEVGALDAIADVVGVCAGMVHLAQLGLKTLVVSPIALGGGRVTSEHGRLGVPAPAVVQLLLGVPAYGGPIEQELCTPTGAALLVTHATGYGLLPAMTTSRLGLGAGGRDPQGHTNALRLILGEPADDLAQALVMETNVDDLDPRLWPDVIAALLAAGASDAWLSPILMKKGRPAYTLHVLASAAAAGDVRRTIFEQTSTIGLREHLFAKHSLARRMEQVQVDGRTIAVKVASYHGRVLNLQPEYADVAAAARASGRPIKDVLAAANAAAQELVQPEHS